MPVFGVVNDPPPKLLAGEANTTNVPLGVGNGCKSWSQLLASLPAGPALIMLLIIGVLLTGVAYIPRAVLPGQAVVRSGFSMLVDQVKYTAWDPSGSRNGASDRLVPVLPPAALRDTKFVAGVTMFRILISEPNTP